MIATALRSQTNIGKSFQSFFIETMELFRQAKWPKGACSLWHGEKQSINQLFLTHTGRLNFTRMARCGRSCESRFRQNFKKPFDWFSFNRTFLEQTMGHRIAICCCKFNIRWTFLVFPILKQLEMRPAKWVSFFGNYIPVNYWIIIRLILCKHPVNPVFFSWQSHRTFAAFSNHIVQRLSQDSRLFKNFTFSLFDFLTFFFLTIWSVPE